MFSFRILVQRFLKPDIRRTYVAKQNYDVEIEKKVLNDIENEQYKPRKHPGVVKKETIAVPEQITKAIRNVTADFPVKSVVQDSIKLLNCLEQRHAPIEKEEFTEKKKRVEREIISLHGNDNLSQEEKSALFTRYRGKMYLKLKSLVHIWKPIEYDNYTALQYCYARFAQEYAVLHRIFSELKQRNSEFVPRSVFDFGSGVGTSIWAVNSVWNQSVFEHFCVDASPAMNDLSDALVKGGFPNKKPLFKGIFYRQFLPATNRDYDIVLSAYSLFELPSVQNRLELLLNLWNKTKNYLIIVEYGSNAGFQLVNEARDFILNIKDEHNVGHVVMPCPHDKPCPRFLNDNTPCNFELNYVALPFGKDHLKIKKESYTYVVLKKGQRNPNDQQWPRIVRPTLVKSKHSICRLCTSEGQLEEVIFTASKHGRTTYRCAKGSKWGDCLPMNISKSDNEPDTDCKE